MKHNTFFLLALLLSISSCRRDEQDKAVVFSGSDTEKELVELLAAKFSKSHHSFDPEVKGGGTEVGIEDLLNDECSVINASRELSKKEIARFESSGIHLKSYAIALDAVGIITHPSLRIDSLSILQLQAILTGSIDNWKEVGGPDLRIRIYGRNKKSGTYAFMKQRFIGDRVFGRNLVELPTNRDIIQAVSVDKSGIGYVGSGFLRDDHGKPTDGIWVMNLYVEGSLAYSPFEYSAIVNGEYPIIRPLLQYTDGLPIGQLAAYFKFVLSREGQQLVREFGYYPITSQYSEHNNKNGITVTSEVSSSI